MSAEAKSGGKAKGLSKDERPRKKRTMRTTRKNYCRKFPNKQFKHRGQRFIPFMNQRQKKKLQRGRHAWKGVFRDPVKLHLSGVIMGYQRSRQVQHEQRSLVRIEDVKSKAEAKYYMGHRVIYIYRSKQKKDPVTGKGSLRVITGKITRTHGCNGMVRVNFRPNLPPQSHGQRCRVMMWPHTSPN